MACDVANSVADVWFRLGFLSQSDLNAASWITASDLYQFADDAVKHLVSTNGMFKTFDQSVAIASGTGIVTMPAGHVFTVFAYIYYGPSNLTVLRLTNVEQLYALDAAWPSEAGPPERLAMDAGAPGTGGLGIGTLYPAATQAGTLCQVLQQMPATVASGASVLPISPVVQDYFTYAALQVALSRESDFARPEVAAHCAERMRLMEKVFNQYYGSGQ